MNDFLEIELTELVESEPPLGACCFVHKRLIGAAVGFVTGGPTGAVSGFVGGGQETSAGFTGANRGQGLGTPVSCPPGRIRVGTNCIKPSAAAPGGVPFVTSGGGAVVMGAFGLPAMQPEVVGNITRRDGSTGPILRCEPGLVLATDNLCYAKGTKGLAANRKWKPGTRPFLTGGDVKVLRRANTLRNSKGSKKLLKELGLGG